MSSLAAATAAFTKKKEEGLALLVAKRELEELKESGRFLKGDYTNLK
jgi:hypothetical protein